MCNFVYLCSGPGIVKLLIIVLAIPIQICFIAGYVTSTYLLGSGELTQESCEARDVQPTNLTVNMESPCPTRMLLQISLAINGVGLNACGLVFILLILCELNRVQWFKMIDIGGHIIGAVAMLTGGVLCIVYCSLAMLKVKCEGDAAGQECWAGREATFQMSAFGAAAGLMILNALLFLLAAWLVKKENIYVQEEPEEEGEG